VIRKKPGCGRPVLPSASSEALGQPYQPVQPRPDPQAVKGRLVRRSVQLVNSLPPDWADHGRRHQHQCQRRRSVSQRLSLIFKSLAVRRIYDKKDETLVYVIYSRQVKDASAKMSISTVPLYGVEVKWTRDKQR